MTNMDAILEFILKTENAPFLLGILGAFAFLWLNRDSKMIKEHLTNHVTSTEKKIDQLNVIIRGLDTKIDNLDEKWDRKFSDLDQKIDMKIGSLDEKWDRRFIGLDNKIGGLDNKIGNLESNMNDIKLSLVKLLNQKTN